MKFPIMVMSDKNVQFPLLQNTVNFTANAVALSVAAALLYKTSAVALPKLGITAVPTILKVIPVSIEYIGAAGAVVGVAALAYLAKYAKLNF